MTRTEVIGYVVKAIDAVDNVQAALRNPLMPGGDYAQTAARNARRKLWTILESLVERELGEEKYEVA